MQLSRHNSEYLQAEQFLGSVVQNVNIKSPVCCYVMYQGKSVCPPKLLHSLHNAVQSVTNFVVH